MYKLGRFHGGQGHRTLVGWQEVGVGLHVGTALLQIYGEIGLQPIIRSMDRIKSLANDEDHPPSPEYVDRIRKAASDFEVFKIKMAKEYRGHLVINTVVAAILTAALVVLAYMAQQPIPTPWTAILVSLSTLPAPVTLFVLWVDAERELRPLKADIASIEAGLLGG